MLHYVCHNLELILTLSNNKYKKDMVSSLIAY